MCSGLTTAKELPGFRSMHPVPLTKKNDQTRRSTAPLPSDKNPAHTYGMPGSFRSAQTVREKGAVEAPMKHIVQVRVLVYVQVRVLVYVQVRVLVYVEVA